MVKKYVVVTALALVGTTGWAQEPQDSIESVDKYLNLKEVVIKGGLPHTRLKGNAMVTRVDGTALASSGSLGELLVKVPGMTGTDEAPEVLGKGTPLIYINGRKMRDDSELKRLRSEGYRVDGLPSTLDAFTRLVRREGKVLGTYALEAQRRYMHEGHPLWLSRRQYEQWAAEVLAPEKYAEVVSHYGPFPGELLARGDSLAVACLRFGNILLFPQPRPALGDDDFRLVIDDMVLELLRS